MVHFKPVRTEDDQRKLAQMAHDIWFEYWPPIIGENQVAYMVDRFQSFAVIQRDMAEHGYEYWFIQAEEADGTRTVGYTGGCADETTNRFFISKIYLAAEERGKGFARETVRFYEQLAQERGLSSLYLTVNKRNDLGVRAYRGTGFTVIDAVETDIGAGFVMDDYIMQKDLG